MTTDKLSSRDQLPGSDAREYLQDIINWADLAHAHPGEFNSHGLGLLRGPVFDDARAFLADPATCDAQSLSGQQGGPPAPSGLVDAVRPEVYAFALLMERELRANDHKPGWKNDDPMLLADRVWQETEELRSVIRDQDRASAGDRRRLLVASEAADVANMAMMVADLCGCLDATLSGQQGGAVPAGAEAAFDRAAMVEVADRISGGLQTPNWRPTRTLVEEARNLLRRAVARLAEQPVPAGAEARP